MMVEDDIQAICELRRERDQLRDLLEKAVKWLELGEWSLTRPKRDGSGQTEDVCMDCEGVYPKHCVDCDFGNFLASVRAALPKTKDE
jgi:hypothetical protein